MGCACGFSIASSTGSSRLSETTTSTLRQRIGALQLPGHAGGVRRDLFRARLRIDAVGLDVLLEPMWRMRVGVRIIVRQVRPLAGIGIDEHDLRADLAARCGWLR